MAKGSGGTGGGKGGGTSRGQQLKAKYGDAEKYLEGKFPDRFYQGGKKPPELVTNLAKNTRQRRDVKEGVKYKNPKATNKSRARNERKRSRNN